MGPNWGAIFDDNAAESAEELNGLTLLTCPQAIKASSGIEAWVDGDLQFL